MAFRRMNVAVASRSTPILSIDGYQDLVFIIRCARRLAILQMLPGWFLPPKDERISPKLLRKLIRKLRKLVPKGTRSTRKMPRSIKELSWEFFLVVRATELSGAEIRRGGHPDVVEVIEEVYSRLCEVGANVLEKKLRKKADVLRE